MDKQIFAKVKLRLLNGGGECWSVYPPSGHRIDCTSKDAAEAIAKDINAQITARMKIGGHAE